MTKDPARLRDTDAPLATVAHETGYSSPYVSHAFTREFGVTAGSRLAEIIAPLWHEGMNDRLSAMARLRLHLVRHRMLDEVLELVWFEKELARSKVATPVVVDGGRAYARYPFFRAPARAVPDDCYDVTAQLGVRHHVTRAELRDTTLHLAGYGYLHRVETRDVTTELVLRERESGTEFRLPVTHTATPGLGAAEDEGRYAYDLAGFEAAVDITTAADGRPLGDGLWDISLAIGAQGLTKEVRIGSKRADRVSGRASTRVVRTADGLRAVTLYTTNPHGNFTLELGERKHRVARGLGIGTGAGRRARPPSWCSTGAAPSRPARTTRSSSSSPATAERRRSSRRRASRTPTPLPCVWTCSGSTPGCGAVNSVSATAGTGWCRCPRCPESSARPSGAAAACPGTPSRPRTAASGSPCRSRGPTWSGRSPAASSPERAAAQSLSTSRFAIAVFATSRPRSVKSPLPG
ncbi:hypothetical protein ABZV31_10345 [Streptomyces sp. NPDC005202]|uniref:hypothetical protein n=1 Tax=Streptomyces sp. NPDC005202 TaxID=3157021 RepID=UPI0033B98119